LAYFGYIFFGGNFIGMLIKMRHTPGKYYPFKVKLLAEFLTGIVQPPAQAEASVSGVYKHIYAVQHLAIIIVGVKCVVTGNFS
jgi:hypothetical protein